MPELPDLQAFSRNLTKIFKGKKVDKAEVEVSRKLNVPAKELQDTLKGCDAWDFLLHLLKF